MVNDNIADVYHRQELLEGWNQSAWRNAKVAVIGAGTLANVVDVGLTALGTARIYSYSSDIVSDNTGEEFLYFRSAGSTPRVRVLEDMLPSLNRDVSVKGVELDLSYESEARRLGKPSVIAELTNDPESKLIALEYGWKNKIPVVTASAAQYNGGYSALYKPRDDREAHGIVEGMLFPEYAKCRQGIIPSFIIGGLVVREITGLVMPRAREEKLDEIIYYDLSSGFRFLHYPKSMSQHDPEALAKYNLQVSRRISVEEVQARQLNMHAEELCDYKLIIDDFFRQNGTVKGVTADKVKFKNDALVIGVGALGSPSTTALALSGVKRLTLLDPDTIESTNLNRQFLFCFTDSVGRHKAEVAAEVLSEIAPDVELNPIAGKLDLSFEQILSDANPDMLVLGVDAFKWEALANQYSLKHGLPAVYGGTKEDLSGRVAVAWPGKTACLQHQVSIDESAQSQHRPASCIYAPSASVVTNNLIVGGGMAGECGTFARPDIHKKLLRGIIKYTSRDSSRICLLPSARSCGCNSGGWEEWLSRFSHLY